VQELAEQIEKMKGADVLRENLQRLEACVLWRAVDDRQRVGTRCLVLGPAAAGGMARR
jgi:hypothetical protein